MASERRKVVLSLVGEQGAGKSTIGQKLARYLDTTHIEISGVVKALTNNHKADKAELVKTREKTAEDPTWLGEAVYERCLEAYDTGKRSVVITGVREVEVYDYLKRRGVLVIGIDVVADPDIRCQRLMELGKISDEQAFIEQDIKEVRMGLHEVMGRSEFQISTSYLTDADEIVRKTVSAITNKKRKLR